MATTSAFGEKDHLPEALGWEEVQTTTDPLRFSRWWAGLLQRQPGLFAHWRVIRSYG
jgi:hypothetical protein